MTTRAVPSATTDRPAARRTSVGATAVGGFYLTMGGVHLGLVVADPTVYGPFADGAVFGFVRTGWSEIFMANPVFWGLLVMAGELALGTLLIVGGRAALVGWAGVILFHVALMLFGWGAWLWSVPALAVLVPLALRDLRAATRR
ncbi:hypothetical protein [Nocardioides sp.]|uniref:hypothetical protein n=1 Tax=Nocardioides sp. TaxID=35761 RepID=UPI002ED1A95E